MKSSNREVPGSWFQKTDESIETYKAFYLNYKKIKT